VITLLLLLQEVHSSSLLVLLLAADHTKYVQLAQDLYVDKLTNPVSNLAIVHCVSKNAPTLKWYSAKLQGSILMTFGRNILYTLE